MCLINLSVCLHTYSYTVDSVNTSEDASTEIKGGPGPQVSDFWYTAWQLVKGERAKETAAAKFAATRARLIWGVKRATLDIWEGEEEEDFVHLQS